AVRARDGSTYWIRSGHHPRISFPNLADFPDVEIRVRYFYNRERKHDKEADNNDNNDNNKKDIPEEHNPLHYVETVTHHEIDKEEEKDKPNNKEPCFQVDNCPRHFLWLSDQAVEYELEYRREHGTWRERVLVEKLYFTLFYGGTGLASKYMDFVDDFQTELEGWNVMDLNRTTSNKDQHCEWEGVECDEEKNIVKFSIHGFSLEGSLPTDLHHMTSLKHLALNGNLIQGTLPSSWGKLTNLITLNMSDNLLSGTIPKSLGKMTNLEKLWFKSNRLEGTIADKFIEQWSQLNLLDFSQNKFHGKIPKALVTKATNLDSLSLDSNALTGTLPELLIVNEGTAGANDSATGNGRPMDSSAFAALGELQFVDFSNNMLSGTIPTTWLALPLLEELDLAKNSFHGTIPPSILQCTKLDSLILLDLGDNALEGTIPSTIGKMTVLEQFHIQNNKLDGTLPVEMNRMQPDVKLNLTSNL
ncbi:MAG: hypothetical protein SGILL_000812, partial [Bacillariaceae sp.]